MSGVLITAVTAGKRVRAETGIAKGAVSVSSAAAEFTVAQLPGDCGIADIGSARIAVIGAGKMARLLLIHLESLGVRDVTVVNLTLESVAELAAEFPDMKITGKLMGDLYDVIAAADVVYPCTASQISIVDKEPLHKALEERKTNNSGEIS